MHASSRGAARERRPVGGGGYDPGRRGPFGSAPLAGGELSVCVRFGLVLSLARGAARAVLRDGAGWVRFAAEGCGCGGWRRRPSARLAREAFWREAAGAVFGRALL